MNYYLDAVVQLHINKLKEAKGKGFSMLNIDKVIIILDQIQKINNDEINTIDFNLEKDFKK